MGIDAFSDEQLSALQQALEEGVDRLSQSFPMSLATVALRESDGRVVVIAGEVAEHLTGLVEERPPVAPEAFDWVDVNRQILTLTVGPRLRVSELYQPLIELGLESGLVAPIPGDGGGLLGVLVIGSRHVGGYFKGELEMVREFAESLAGHMKPAKPQKPSIAEVQVRLREIAKQLVTEAAEEREKVPSETETRSLEVSTGEGEREGEGGITVRADELGRIRDWDRRAEELFGWRAEEVIGRFLTLLVQQKSGNVLDIRLRERLLAEGAFAGRTITWRRDGTPVVCNVRLSKLTGESGGAKGFVGRIEAVPSPTLLPREPVELSFVELYDFSNLLS